MNTHYYLLLQRHVVFSVFRQLVLESNNSLFYTRQELKKLHVNQVSDNLVLFQDHWRSDQKETSDEFFSSCFLMK